MKAVLLLALVALFVPSSADVAYPNNPECGWGDQTYRSVGDWPMDAGAAANWNPAEPLGVMTPTYVQPCEYALTVHGLMPGKLYNWKVTIGGENTGWNTNWGCVGFNGPNCQFTADSTGSIIFKIVAKDAYVLSTENTVAPVPLPPLNRPKKVFAHYMMGFTYNDDQAFFLSTIAAAQAVGIDGFAVNVGADSYQPDKFQLFIDAAAAKNFTLFISLDMDFINSVSVMNNWINRFANHSAYFRFEDAKNVSRPFVSTFSGQWTDFGYGVGNAAWARWKSQDVGSNNIYFCPAWFAADSSDLAGLYNLFPVIDCLFSWDAWEKSVSNARDTPAVNTAHTQQKTYMSGVAPWFYCHLPQYGKNWFWPQGPNDGAENVWITRWKQVIALAPDFVEIVTWNDFTESSYIAPLSTQEVPSYSNNYTLNDGGMDHVAFLKLTAYFAQWYKTGVAPKLTTNSVYWWYRIHAKNQTRNDPAGPPTMYWADPSDCVSVYALSQTVGALVTVTIGGRVTTINITSTEQYACVPYNGVGEVRIHVHKNGNKISGTQGPNIQGNGTTYNFNVWSGALDYPSTMATGPRTATRTATRVETFVETFVEPERECGKRWDQCGGKQFTGPKCCKNPHKCEYSNEWYSQCK